MLSLVEASDGLFSNCQGCGEPTRGRNDLLCRRCWKHVPPEAHAEYLRLWRLAINDTPSVPIARDDPRMRQAVAGLVSSRQAEPFTGKRRLVRQYLDNPPEPVEPSPIGTRISLAELERLHLTALLPKMGWSQTATAKVLGISTRSVKRKMLHYGLKRPRNIRRKQNVVLALVSLLLLAVLVSSRQTYSAVAAAPVCRVNR